jgi:protoporphyrinogen oxidase
VFLKISAGLEKEYSKELSKLKGLGAINLILSLRHTFLPTGTYWLNINENSFPILAIVEHTNFVDIKHYGNEHLIYIANYLPPDHKYYSYAEKDLLDEYLPCLKKINKDFSRDWINKSWVYKSSFAQPIVELITQSCTGI